MIRKIIRIDVEKCNGCELCTLVCHEGALAMVGGKAKLVRDEYCDGLGNCLPVCPRGAISFEVRAAAPYNSEAVTAVMRDEQLLSSSPSRLKQWPVQIKLVSPDARCFKDAHLLIAADCAAYACGNFHAEHMKGKVTIIGCPKLDGTDYSEKLTEILKNNDIQSVTVIRMEVPCCCGITKAVITALQNCRKVIPWWSVMLSTDGDVVDG